LAVSFEQYDQTNIVLFRPFGQRLSVDSYRWLAEKRLNLACHFGRGLIAEIGLSIIASAAYLCSPLSYLSGNRVIARTAVIFSKTVALLQILLQKTQFPFPSEKSPDC